MASWNSWRTQFREITPDLAGADLAGRDLSGNNLAGSNLSGARLERANLQRASLRGADLTGASLDGADLSRADCTEAVFVRASCKGVNFAEAVLEHSNFSDAICTEGLFTRANLRGACFEGASLADASFEYALLDEVDLDSITRGGGDWSRAVHSRQRVLEVEGLSGFDEPAWAAGPPREKGAPSRQLPPPKTTNLFTVWYGTNRRPRDARDYKRGYGQERDNRVHYGECRVLIPRSHRIGSVGSSWIKRVLRGRDDRLKLQDITQVAEAAFWAGLRDSMGILPADERTALVFLHGYNVSFEAAALRAAQIGYDLGACGATAFFSWPSRANWRAYLPDGESIEASEDEITQFLVGFADLTDAHTVHVIAHSMGNRALLRAAQRIVQAAQERSKKPFGQIILAAPDVDTDVFASLCPAYDRLASRTTMYVSKTDLAVRLSAFVHGFGRVGWIPPVTVVDGIDTVEVTDADLAKLGLGHGHLGLIRVLYDIYELIRSGRPPGQRMALRAQRTPEGREYWAMGE